MRRLRNADLGCVIVLFRGLLLGPCLGLHMRVLVDLAALVLASIMLYVLLACAIAWNPLRGGGLYLCLTNDSFVSQRYPLFFLYAKESTKSVLKWVQNDEP